MTANTTSPVLLKPLPPMVSGLPILGNALVLLKDPLSFMVENYKRSGPIYRFRALNHEYTVMAGPEANQFLIKQGNLLSNKRIYGGIGEGMQTDYFILAQDGARHRFLRKTLQHGYSKQIFVSQMAKAIQLTRDMIRDWQPADKVRVVPFFKRLITDQLGIMLMNHAPGDYFPDIQTFFTTITQVHVL